MSDFQTKGKILRISHDGESVKLEIENTWLPQETIVIDCAGSPDGVSVGDGVTIEITVVKRE